MLVGLHIKHLGFQDGEHLCYGVVIYHECAQHGLFEFHSLRGELARGAENVLNAVV